VRNVCPSQESNPNSPVLQPTLQSPTDISTPQSRTHLRCLSRSAGQYGYIYGAGKSIAMLTRPNNRTPSEENQIQSTRSHLHPQQRDSQEVGVRIPQRQDMFLLSTTSTTHEASSPMGPEGKGARVHQPHIMPTERIRGVIPTLPITS
jgi:hypothetical protein